MSPEPKRKETLKEEGSTNVKCSSEVEMRKEPVEFATLKVPGNLSKVSFSGVVEAEAR